MNINFDGRINPSDLKYYLNLREQKEFKINHSKLQEFFPLNIVIDGTFKIYQVKKKIYFKEFILDKIFFQDFVESKV